jgi:hypothetical protein
LGGLQFKTSPGKKLVRPHLNQNLGRVVHAGHPSNGRKQTNKKRKQRIRLRLSWAESEILPISKLTRAKRAGGIVQVL